MLETLSRGESMLIQSSSSEETVLFTFHARKILTIDELCELLSCSAITSRRRLKQWQALTSYNQNNRYYTLPSIPIFNKLGLWCVFRSDWTPIPVNPGQRWCF